MRVFLAFAAQKWLKCWFGHVGTMILFLFFKSLLWSQMFNCCVEEGRFSRLQCGDFKINLSSKGSKMCFMWLAERMASLQSFSWSLVPIPECFLFGGGNAHILAAFRSVTALILSFSPRGWLFSRGSKRCLSPPMPNSAEQLHLFQIRCAQKLVPFFFSLNYIICSNKMFLIFFLSAIL